MRGGLHAGIAPHRPILNTPPPHKSERHYPRMLEAQRNRIYLASRLKAHGASEEEVEALKNAGKQPFKPAFVAGKRKARRSEVPTGTFEVPTGSFTVPKKD